MADQLVSSHLGRDLVQLRRVLAKTQLDGVLMLLLIAIVSIGLFVLYSALKQDIGMFLSQLLRIVVALIALILIAQTPLKIVQFYTPFFYALSVVLVVAVLFWGDTTKGATRWIDIPVIPRFQPSEVLKLSVPLMLAWYYHNKPWPMRIRDIAAGLLIIALPLAFVYLQPDFGTMALVGAGSLTVLYFAGLQWRWIFSGAFVGFAGLVLAWRYVFTEYQISRLKTFLNPESDALGNGWNLLQSKTALGSGGFVGKGYLEGSQSNLDFLPEGHTDFIFAVVGEEFGFVGCAALLVLFFGVFARGQYLCLTAETLFARYAIGGFTMVFFLYTVINGMMVCGMLPVVGAPLPLVSYGGTSAMTFLVGFGIVIALYSNRALIET